MKTRQDICSKLSNKNKRNWKYNIFIFKKTFQFSIKKRSIKYIQCQRKKRT